jgi:hypothetical protein
VLHNAKGRADNISRASKGTSHEQDNNPIFALGQALVAIAFGIVTIFVG